MSDESAIGRVRARCVWWLSGQCKGGATCACLPWPQPDKDPSPDPIRPPAKPADDE
jgi:hypothetical protein